VDTARFYWKLYRVALKSRAEYRVDFAVGVLTAVLSQLSALAFYWVVWTQAPTIAGWPPSQVLFLFGVTAMVLGVSELLLNGIWWLPWYILGGELDRLLVSPVNSLGFLLTARPELHALGNIASGAAVVGFAFHLAPPPLIAFVLIPLWVACGTAIYTAGLVLASCLSFGVVGPWSHHYMLVHHLLNAARYPASLYPAWLKYGLLFVFPIATATFVPGQWLRGEASLALSVAAPIAAAFASLAAASKAWQSSINRYQSTGS
jgi:ABC-2 type transport system permease protein